MKKKIIPILAGASLLVTLGAAITFNQKYTPTFATYTNGDGATYYSTIDDTKSGNDLLTDLRSLNLSKRKSTVGYSSMGTSPSGQFKYTDYDTSTVQYDSNGQPYGTKISSFYTYTSATSWNREHVWPNSHGGGNGGDAGSPYPDADIHMPRPTISSENSSRGNSFFVEGMNHSSNGWDPYTAGYSKESRGEAARITFYCTLVNSKLILAPNNTTPSGKDSVTGQSYGSGHTMGNLETLIKWNIEHPVTDREKNRNEGAEYLQGNRNPFVDHPEYACKIWGAVNSNIANMCSNASYPSVSHTAGIREDDGYNIASVNTTSKTLAVGDSVNFLPFVDGEFNASVSWSLSDYTVASSIYYGRSTYTNGVTITALAEGTTTLTLTYEYDDNGDTKTATATVAITVSNSGSGGGGGSGEEEGSLVLITSTASLNNGDKVVLATQEDTPKGVTGYNNNKDATVSTDDTEWVQFVVGSATSSGWTLQDSGQNKYIASPSGNEFKYSTTGGQCSVNSNGQLICSNRYLCVNGSNYRFYTSAGSYPTFYVYKVVESSGGEEEVTLSSIAVTGTPKTEYTVGDTFVKPTITATYSDNSQETVTNSATFSGYDLSTAGNYTVTVSYTEGGVARETTYSITVSAQVVAKTLSSIEVTSTPKTSYTVGDSFEKPTVTATYSDSTQENVTNSATFTGYDLSTAGNYTVTVSYTYQGTTETTSYAITVTASGGGQQIEQESQRIVAKSDSSYYTSGSIYPTGSTSTATASCDAFDLTWNKNSGSNSIAYTYDELRVYTSHSFMITPKSGYTITRIDIVANSNSYATAVGGSSLTNCTKNVSGSNVTLTPTDGTATVGFTNSAQSRLNYVVVNYEYESQSSTKSLTSITLDTTNVKTQFVTGSAFTYSGLVVTAYYDDSTSATVTPTSVSSPNMSTAGQKTITVTYTENEVSQSNTYTITVSANFITATVSKTYYVGDTIVSSDITVVDGNDNSITSFTFTNNNYQFKYSDAASGGDLTEKVFENAISYSNMTCSLTVQVQRKARVDSSSQTLTVTYTDLPTTYQTSTTERTAASGVKFIAYNLANYSSKMQFKASGGYFQTTESMSLKTLTINNRETNALTVYGSTDGTTFSQTITGTNDVYDLTGYTYFKVMKNGSGAAYCASLTIAIGSSDSAENVANYIMYEDTNKQCETKLDIAIGYLNDLDSDELDEFMDSSDYVIATARERLDAWAANQHKSITIDNGEVSLTNNSIHTGLLINRNNNSIWIIIIITVALSSCAAVMVFRKKSRQ